MKVEPALPAAHESCAPAETVQGPLEVVIVKGEERSPYSRNVAQVPVLAVARSQVRSGGYTPVHRGRVRARTCTTCRTR